MLANKKETINPKNSKCNCCFAYSIAVALNHQNIKNHPERTTNIIPFVDKYDWSDIDFPAGIKDWKNIKGITSNHKGDYYSLNCLRSFRSYNVLKKHEKLCENNDYSYIEMPTKKIY